MPKSFGNSLAFGGVLRLFPKHQGQRIKRIERIQALNRILAVLVTSQYSHLDRLTERVFVLTKHSAQIYYDGEMHEKVLPNYPDCECTLRFYNKENWVICRNVW